LDVPKRLFTTVAVAQISLPKSATARARSGSFLMPLGSVNQEVVIELVDEKPTDEMMSALERFWEKVFVELVPSEEGSSVKAKRMNWTTRKS
jgi:hypothetical protein